MANVEQITKTYGQAARRFLDETKPETSDYIAAVWDFSAWLDKANALDDRLVIAGLQAMAEARGKLADELATALAKVSGPEAVKQIVAKFRLKTKRESKKQVPEAPQE